MGPVIERPRTEQRRRGSERRRWRFVVSIGLLAALVVTTFAWGRARSGIRVRQPVEEVCVGESFRVGVRYRAWIGGRRWYRLKVWNPDDTRILSRSGRAPRQWRHWWIPVTDEGTYRVVYRWSGRRRVFLVDARDCSPPSESLFLNLPDGRVIFDLENMSPGDVTAGCVTVGYSEGPPISVRLYGETGGTGLADHLHLRVERGTTEPVGATATCGGFALDAEDHDSRGPGVLYEGSLAGWPDDWTSGVVDPDVWSPGDSRSYRFVVSLPADAGNETQGLTALQTFIWHGQE